MANSRCTRRLGHSGHAAKAAVSQYSRNRYTTTNVDNLIVQMFEGSRLLVNGGHACHHRRNGTYICTGKYPNDT